MTTAITIHVHMTPAIYRRYVNFDTFRRQRRWFFPLLIGVLFITGSTITLFALPGQSGTVSGLLMGLGLAIPLFCFGIYFLQLQAQISSQNLKEAPELYALKLTHEEVAITGMQQKRSTVAIPWDKVWAAFRYHDDIYLYVNPERAVILPSGQADAGQDAVWALITQHLPADKVATIGKDPAAAVHS